MAAKSGLLNPMRCGCATQRFNVCWARAQQFRELGLLDPIRDFLAGLIDNYRVKITQFSEFCLRNPFRVRQLSSANCNVGNETTSGFTVVAQPDARLPPSNPFAVLGSATNQEIALLQPIIE